MLAELAAVDERDRTGLVVGWWLRSIGDLRGIVLQGRSLGDEVDDDLAKIDAQKAEIKAYPREHDARMRRWQTEKELLADR
jgi:hypothetical protein